MEQQLSRGSGIDWSADITEAQRMLRLANCVCVFTGRAVGSVTAGRPKRTVPEGSGFVEGVSGNLVGVAC